MKSLTELFPALAECHLETDDPRHALLQAPSSLAGKAPILHPAFRDVRSQLFSSVKGSPLTLLIGVSGVGKTRLVASLVERLNRFLAHEGRIPAVYLVAPTAQRRVFTWKGFWERLLTALHDPLPEQKIHPRVRADALRSRSMGKSRSTTESQYFEMACSAAEERGLVLLVIDEATALARSESGVTLIDQIAVLRELADKDLFRIVMVSTFDILPHFRRAGVLDRRLSTVVFPRYPEILSASAAVESGETSSTPPSIDPTDDGYLAFSRSALTFMERLPSSLRFELGQEQYVKLYRGSLGCVGLLCDWYLRAAAECLDSRDRRLAWRHFSRTPLPVDRRANLILEARCAEAELALLRDLRLDITEDELYAIALQQAKSDLSRVRPRRSHRTSALRTPKKIHKPRRQPGVPNAKATPLP